MTIDWASFTPWPALAGGVVIGLATALLVLVNGRIAGVSGILASLLRPRVPGAGWRLAFVAGLLVAPVVYAAFAALPGIVIEASHVWLVVAGILVGAGTRLSRGCTSGHGVCGVSRLSPRSMFATVVFMAAGIATVYVVRHVLAA